MPAALTYPGVYIEEISSGVRTITGVATSIAAFVGRAKRGPVDKPVVINGFADFERKFGGLWEASTLGYAVRDFFVNGGGQAIIVRVYSPDRVGASEQAAQQATTAASAVVKAVTDRAAVAGPPAPTTADLKTAADTAATAAGAAGPAAKGAADAVAKATKDAADVAGATVADVVGKAKDAAAPAIAAATATGTPKTRALVDAKGFKLEAAYDGLWGNYLRARIDAIDAVVAQDISDRLHLPAAKIFNLTVRDTKNDVTEVFRNVSVDDSPRQVARVLEAESSLVRVQSAPGTLPTGPHDQPATGDDIWAKDTLSSKVADADKVADDGNALSRADFTGPGKEGKKRGLYALKDADIFNLLCIPPHLHGSDIEPALIDDAATFCADRRALLLIDPPSNWKDKDAAKAGITNAVGAVSKNAAIYFPRIKASNILHEGRIEEFVPCGVVAGIFARTDTTRGVWKAPAGLDATLAGVAALSVNLTDPENGELNPLGINCLRTMPAAGPLIWGARTRVGDDRLASEWKYVPVRRTALYIEESLYRGTQWVVFEPNDEPLWAEIRLNVGAFMQGLFRQGAFQGRSPREAYFVKCDRETTTQNDIDRGIVNIVVGFAPLKPAEFVVIKLQQIAGQIQV